MGESHETTLKIYVRVYIGGKNDGSFGIHTSLRKSTTFHYTASRAELLRWKNSLKKRKSTKRSCESGRRRSLIRNEGINQIRGGGRLARGRRGRPGGEGRDC